MVSAESSAYSNRSFARPIDVDRVLLAIGALGIAARLYVVHVSTGCNDMQTWESFGRDAHRFGLGYLYDNVPGFNHPPVMGWMVGFFMKIALSTGVRFEALFKAPAVLADVLSASLIYRSWQLTRPRHAALAFALFCWSVPSILVTAFHGNTDSICTSFCLLAALLVDRARPMLGGLALGAAMNVKLIPIMLVPLLASSAGGPKRVVRFLIGLSAGALPFLPMLVRHWKGFYAHALMYRSNYEEWGITAVLGELSSASNIGHFARQLDLFWIDQGARPILLVVCTVAAINAWKRRWSARRLTAFGFATFLSLTPGFGVQYLVYPIPALFSVSVKNGLLYSAAAGIYAFMLYYTSWDGSHPFFETIPMTLPLGVQLLGYGAWVSTLMVTVDLL
jgi:4-amino-4-deoxy-L-arabinose transferase-like glycosyltransferase